jgi:ankyrin repeat protein
MIRKTMQAHSAPTQENYFCDLVSNPNTTGSDIERALAEEKIDVNFPHTVKELRPIELAVMFSNMSVVGFLIENISQIILLTVHQQNLLELATTNFNHPPVLQYLLNPSNRIWLKFEDGTTDLHAHAMAGRINAVTEILRAEPDRLLEVSKEGKNVFYWASLTNQDAVITILMVFGDQFITRNIVTPNLQNLQKYFDTMEKYSQRNNSKFKELLFILEMKIKHFTERTNADIDRSGLLNELRRYLAKQFELLSNNYLEDFHTAESDQEQVEAYDAAVEMINKAISLLLSVSGKSAAERRQFHNYYFKYADILDQYARRCCENADDDGNIALYDEAISIYEKSFSILNKVNSNDLFTNQAKALKINNVNSALAAVKKQKINAVNAKWDKFYDPETTTEEEESQKEEENKAEHEGTGEEDGHRLKRQRA